MSDEVETPPAPAPPAESEQPVTRAELEQLRDRVDDVEDVAYSTAAMVLEDDDEEKVEPERTEVAERHEAPAEEKKEDPAASKPAEKHAGLFL